MSEAFEAPAMSMQLGFFVDPTCLWSWLTLPIAGPGRPQPDLNVQWRSHSCLLLLRDGTQELQDQMVAIRTASHRAVRVMEALRRDHPAAVPRFYEALLPRVFAAINAGGPPFTDLEGALVAAELTPRMRRPPMMRPLTSRFAGPWPLRSPPLVG
jgi:hypothetical protein